MTTLDSGAGVPLGVDELGDAELVLRTRSGDRSAFGELWQRHYLSGKSVARSVTSSIDADDLVQEAYAQIYQSILKGGGPTASFRAYLFTAIRNTAAGWGRSRRETATAVLDTFEDPSTSEEAASDALDRSTTAQAFKSLPSRWQEVLWYSEIEQLKPSKIAPLLGMNAAAVAQLTFRAREGLREAWIQAHLRTVADGSDCQWTIERLGAHARHNLGARDLAKVETHLAECARCMIVAAEAKDVSQRLAMVLLPLTIGVTGTAAYLATLQGGGSSIVALAAAPSAAIPGAVTIAGAAGAAPGAAAAHGAAAVGAGSAGGASTALGAGGTAGAGAGGALLAGSGIAAAGAGASVVAAAAVGGGLLSGVVPTIGLIAAGTVLVGSVITGSVLLPAVLSPAPAASAVSVEASGGSDADAAGNGDAGAEAPADGPLADAATETGAAASEDGSESGTDAAQVSALPAGAPALSGATGEVVGSDPVVHLTVTGAPGATVQTLLNGSVTSTATLDDSGAALVTLVPTYGHLRSNPKVVVRYITGEEIGTGSSALLGSLVDLDALRTAVDDANAGKRQNNGAPQGGGVSTAPGQNGEKTPATPATPAQPATPADPPATPANPATPATPATPASPATPAKAADGGGPSKPSGETAVEGKGEAKAPGRASKAESTAPLETADQTPAP